MRMTPFISEAARALLALFVDDGAIAFAILAIVALATVCATYVSGNTAETVLLAGSLFTLFANVMAYESA